MIDNNYQEELIATPIKYDTKLGISERLTKFVLIVSAIHLVIQFMRYLWGEANGVHLKIIIIFVGSIIIIIMLFKPISEIICAKQVIELHNNETINNYGMLDHIIKKYSVNPEVHYSKNIWNNFINPSWDTNAINIFNEIVMVFYKSTSEIFKKLESIENHLCSNSSGLKVANVNILILESKVDKLEAKVDKLEAYVNTRFDRLEQMMIKMQNKLDTL